MPAKLGAAQLASFDFELKYCCDKSNSNDDALPWQQVLGSSDVQDLAFGTGVFKFLQQIASAEKDVSAT